MYHLDDYHYDLPPERIAQHPVADRDDSRLLRLERATGRTSHHRFRDVLDMLRPGDVLVINDTKVLPARLYGKKETGGRVEVLILDFSEVGDARRPTDLDCLLRASRSPRTGARLAFGTELEAEVLDNQNGIFRLRFHSRGQALRDILSRIGHVPLPPYVQRPDTDADRSTYQTIYARHAGAVAAPTAGLHFTKDLMAAIEHKGIGIARLTLHVGYGTFLPVKTADIREHRMHSEWYHIPEETAAAVASARQRGARVVAVGTTSVRTLETAAAPDGTITPGSGRSDLFIYPGYRFKAIDAVITNFHLPGSTLIMLVSAFAGKDAVLSAYHRAIAAGYRFYSYGDAMFIE